MIALIKFNLENEADEIAFNQFNKANNMARALSEIHEYFRKEYKYNNSITNNQYEALNQIILDNDLDVSTLFK